MSLRHVLYKDDLPDDLVFGDVLAIDSEFMGLNVFRDRLCLVQIYDGNAEGITHMVQLAPNRAGRYYDAPNLKKLMADASKQKLMFYARADMRWIGHYLGVIPENVHCLRIASRVARTYTQSHELEQVLSHVLGVRIIKEQQCTNWGAESLSAAQLDYACNDVLYLHALKEALDGMLAAEGRLDVSRGLSQCLPHIVRADLAGWANEDLFAYQVPKAS